MFTAREHGQCLSTVMCLIMLTAVAASLSFTCPQQACLRHIVVILDTVRHCADVVGLLVKIAPRAVPQNQLSTDHAYNIMKCVSSV